MTPAELLEENTRLKKLIKTVSMENNRNTREIAMLKQQVIELQDELMRKPGREIINICAPFGG